MVKLDRQTRAIRLGQSDQYKQKEDSTNRTTRTGHQGLESQDKTARTGKPGKDSQDGTNSSTARIKQADKTVREGQP